MHKLKAFFSRDRLSTPVGQGVVAGIMEVAYIVLVAVFMVATESLFATARPTIIIFGIIALLSLLVLSVAVSGVLMFVWPVHYFVEKKYKESLYAFLATAVTMFVIFAIVFLGAVMVSWI